MEETIKCCDTCIHCDVQEWYCYLHYKPIEHIDDDVCEQWEEYEG